MYKIQDIQDIRQKIGLVFMVSEILYLKIIVITYKWYEKILYFI